MKGSIYKLLRITKHKIYVVWPMIALFFFGIIILIERVGITQNTVEQVVVEEGVKTLDLYQKPGTLIVVQQKDDMSETLGEQFGYVLSCMKVSYDIKYVQYLSEEALSRYEKVILAFTDLSAVSDLRMLTDWVAKGGRVMNLSTYDIGSGLNLIKGKLGILEGATEYTEVPGLQVDPNFMIGANRQFFFDESYAFSLNVLLQDTATAYIWDTRSNYPLLWENPYGKGSFVTMNMALSGKVARGFWCSAYSLLDDISVYPVIDASAFYLDDFPSPVPKGNGEYVWRDYGVDISTFYSNYWWSDMLTWEKNYGIIHTGLIIEAYSDEVEEFETTQTIDRFRFFGNMLLNQGGELGFHGYNHMPLCTEGFDYKGLYDDYVLWPDTDAMKESLLELKDFSQRLYKNQIFQVYVPPSNILSEQGRQAIKEALPEVRVLASTFFPGDCAYEQEFEVAEDGLIETPRITSGMLQDDFAYLASFSELNFQYVQSHFTHPDDVLDEDRGASLGWPKMKESFEDYLTYIYSSAPNIRNVNGSMMGEAVAVYDKLTLNRQKTMHGMKIRIGGFSGQASLLVALNGEDSVITSVEGGTIEQINDRLYLLRATKNKVEINTSK